MLRAYDKATGTDAGAVYMPAPEGGAPMTYLFNGKQYIVVAVSGDAHLAAARLRAMGVEHDVVEDEAAVEGLALAGQRADQFVERVVPAHIFAHDEDIDGGFAHALGGDDADAVGFIA